MGNTESTTTPTGILRHKHASAYQQQEDIAPTLAMMGVARRVYLKKVHVMMLQYSMAKFSNKYGMINKEEFEMALVRAKLTDVQVFDMLFALWDNVDNGEVPYREFCAGISPLACPFDDLSTVLEFAVRVSDDTNSKHIEWRGVYELLTGINLTAKYFGDEHLLPSEIDEIIESLFTDKERITTKDCIKHLSMNAYVNRFASGKSRSRVQFRDVLETKYIFDKEKSPTEYVVDNIDLLIAASKPSSTQRNKRKIKNRKSNTPPPPVKTQLGKEMVDIPLSPLSDNDYADENSGIVGNSIDGSQQDPPWMNKFREFKTEGSLVDRKQRM